MAAGSIRLYENTIPIVVASCLGNWILRVSADMNLRPKQRDLTRTPRLSAAAIGVQVHKYRIST